MGSALPAGGQIGWRCFQARCSSAAAADAGPRHGAEMVVRQPRSGLGHGDLGTERPHRHPQRGPAGPASASEMADSATIVTVAPDSSSRSRTRVRTSLPGPPAWPLVRNGMHGQCGRRRAPNRPRYRPPTAGRRRRLHTAPQQQGGMCMHGCHSARPPRIRRTSPRPARRVRPPRRGVGDLQDRDGAFALDPRNCRARRGRCSRQGITVESSCSPTRAAHRRRGTPSRTHPSARAR